MWWVANLSDFQWTLHPSCLHIAALIFILIPTLCNSCRMNSHSRTVRPGQSELIIWLFTGDGGSGEPSIQCLQTWQGGVKCQLWGQTAPSWWCRPQSGRSVLLSDPSYPDPRYFQGESHGNLQWYECLTFYSVPLWGGPLPLVLMSPQEVSVQE